jgi:hypothetical protein
VVVQASCNLNGGTCTRDDLVLFPKDRSVLVQRISAVLGDKGVQVQQQGADQLVIFLPQDKTGLATVEQLVHPGVVQFIDTGGAGLTVGQPVPAGANYPVIFTSADLDGRLVQAVDDKQTGRPAILFEFKGAAQKNFAVYTRDHVGQYLTITLDGSVIESAVIQSEIDSQGQISGGNLTLDSAKVLAAMMRSGPLVVPLTIISEQEPGKTPTPGSDKGTPTPTTPATPLSVTSVDLTVTPSSIDGLACGSTVTLTYTATFHIAPGGPGGTIQFGYTLNNGRSSTPASVTVGAGQTSQTFTFTSSGNLPPDHTYPGIAEVLVTSPNAAQSPQVQPSGSCVVAGAAFQVTSVDLAVSPTSIAGKACGTALTVTYTVTFHLAPGGPGGTIQFTYTINNGRGSTPASIAVAAGQTTATYSFTWSGNLPPDHTYPGNGGVQVSSPNAVTSALLAPAGQCS